MSVIIPQIERTVPMELRHRRIRTIPHPYPDNILLPHLRSRRSPERRAWWTKRMLKIRQECATKHTDDNEEILNTSNYGRQIFT
jgi:tRNA uridine 5-carbamoylmethylation protein Kti12